MVYNLIYTVDKFFINGLVNGIKFLTSRSV